jgi:triacylglycerol lipase
MKTLAIILLILINILALIGFIYIIGTIIGYIKYEKYKPAIDIANTNNIHCGKPICFPDIIDLPFPSFDTNYNQNIAKYCIYLIQRIYKSVDENTNYIKPSQLTTEIKLNYDGKLFGVISTYQDNIIISFRGTIYINEWVDDFEYEQVYFLKDKNTGLKETLNDSNLVPTVHKGFYDLYNIIRDKIISTLAKLDPDKTKNIIITGHSLGSGIATICLIDLYYEKYNNLLCYVFASPRVGNKNFSKLFDNLNLYNIMNNLDMIPTLPPSVCPNFNNKNQPYIYYNCGKILSFGDNWKSMKNNHDLGIYLANLPK